jgi:nitrilase
MSDVPDEFVLKQSLLDAGCDIIFDGGSSLAAPDGTFAIEPVIGVEGLITYEIDLDLVRRSRRVLDPTGHSFRPDIFQMQVNGTRFDESSLWGQ